MTNGINIQQLTTPKLEYGRMGGKIVAGNIKFEPPLIERLGGKVVAPPQTELAKMPEIARIGGMIVKVLNNPKTEEANAQEPKAETAVTATVQKVKDETPKAETAIAPTAQKVKDETPKVETAAGILALTGPPSGNKVKVGLRAKGNTETQNSPKIVLRSLTSRAQELRPIDLEQFSTSKIRLFGAEEENEDNKAIRWYTIPEAVKEI